MNFYFIYILLLLIRFAIHLKSQPGYIHPDEFFQTVEISAGEVLNVPVDSPWEFNDKYPIRSKAIIELFLIIPIKFYFALIENINDSFTIPTDYLTICRLWTTICSLIIDYCIYIVSVAANVNTKLTLFLHASSHISLVFFSRTFSNIWETQLFSLFLVVFLKETPLISEISQGAIVALGVFCRPTFPVFVLPFIFHRLISMQLFKIIKYFFRGCCGFIPVTIALIICDSVKYKDRLIVTPLNFLFYNTDHNNLIQHGLHRWYTHVLINLPLMLGVLSPLVLLAPLLHRHKRAKHLFITISFPIFILSLFPHQEMRFLLPIFPIAVVLVSSIIMRSSFLRGKLTGLLILHILFSVVSIIFWGYLHEGGLKEAGEVVRNRMHSSSAIAHKIVSYKTFLLPRFVLLSPHIRYSNANLQVYEYPNSLNYSIVNLMGIPESKFWDQLITIAHQMRTGIKENGIRELHLIYPKAYIFQHPEFLKRIGTVALNITIRGHINTDLWPPRVPLSDFFSLHLLTFVVN